MTAPTPAPAARYAAEQFHYDHGAWSYDPRTETSDEGRRRCAIAAADDEAWMLAHPAGLHVVFELDPYPVTHVDYFDCYDAEPERCEIALLLDRDHNVLESLSCIDDASDDYRRVIAAALAGEYRAHCANGTEGTCRHCGRSIVLDDGVWVDSEASGDDRVWRETCDEHDTFVADHEPEEVAA